MTFSTHLDRDCCYTGVQFWVYDCVVDLEQVVGLNNSGSVHQWLIYKAMISLTAFKWFLAQDSCLDWPVQLIEKSKLFGLTQWLLEVGWVHLTSIMSNYIEVKTIKQKYEKNNSYNTLSLTRDLVWWKTKDCTHFVQHQMVESWNFPR
jgi:hypothetical protein